MSLGVGHVKRVLIYRLGSVGDTIVALPCFKLIARVFPEAERRILTNFVHGAKVASVGTILDPMGLVHGCFQYPLNTRDPQTLWRLLQQIRSWEPEVLVYLSAPRGRLKAFRDAAFFKACGISRLIGVPWNNDRQLVRKMPEGDLWESEAYRLARCISQLGEALPDRPESYQLDLTAAEQQKAGEAIEKWEGVEKFVCASIGTKADSKDWGKTNWTELLDRWSKTHTDVGLIMTGSADEVSLSDELLAAWHGPTLNLCGRLTPRETAAVLEKAALFVGHDSGPMHLAAAVDTPCVAIFSARSKPGVWFPFGSRHRILYHRTPCYGCDLTVCENFNKMCISSITVAEVSWAMTEIYQLRRCAV